MTQAIVVTGTDTDVGKTVFAAALVAALGGTYWKPIQAGLDGETDSAAVQRLSGVPAERILPEVYRLKTPASPHHAARLDGIAIDAQRLAPPRTSAPLVIEGAGGLMVPLSDDMVQIDLFARWKLPVVLVSSTRLGTINHTLLSVEALKRRAVPILGVAFTGDRAPETLRIVAKLGGVKVLGTLPRLYPLDAVTLKSAFTANFSVADILGLGMGGP